MRIGSRGGNRGSQKIVVLLCAVLLHLAGLSVVSVALADSNFSRWLDNFFDQAAREGITSKTWTRAFAGIDSPDQEVLRKARYQPEFTTEIWDYLDARVNDLSVRRGREMAKTHSATLKQVSARFSIPSSILLAIWSMESNYGAIFSKPERLHYVPLALATLAYGDSKRSGYARKQLIAALKIFQNGDIGRNDFSGSWAGAMGHTQFIPTSYLAYRVDMDGDGRCDIWNSIPDALATAASLLSKNGWRPGKPWGYEVKIPAGIGNLVEQTMTLEEWKARGVRPINVGGDTAGFAFPQEKAVLKLPAGPDGPAFLVMRNFYIIKRYNNADSYALAVCLLSDRLAGGKGMATAWPRLPGALSGKEKFELQRLLKKGGYYSGEVDGMCGEMTMGAIRDFERAKGHRITGRVGQDVLKKLRKLHGAQ